MCIRVERQSMFQWTSETLLKLTLTFHPTNPVHRAHRTVWKTRLQRFLHLHQAWFVLAAFVQWPMLWFRHQQINPTLQHGRATQFRRLVECVLLPTGFSYQMSPRKWTTWHFVSIGPVTRPWPWSYEPILSQKRCTFRVRHVYDQLSDRGWRALHVSCSCISLRLFQFPFFWIISDHFTALASRHHPWVGSRRFIMSMFAYSSSGSKKRRRQSTST